MSTTISFNNSPKTPPQFTPPQARQPQMQQPKQGFHIDFHWVLTVFLIFYSLFSFAWIAVLYSGTDGIRPCKDTTNFVCQIEFPYTKQATVAVNEKTQANSQLTKQKAAKNYLREQWIGQATVADDLVNAEQEYEKASTDYKNYVTNYIRFLESGPQLLSGLNQTDFENKKAAIDEALNNVRQKRNTYSENKTESKRKIDQLYTDLKERQENSLKQNR
jgi:hypothetical protein